tara:strand:+ start:199 stop:696 length:498 start_codon:yes stop_codon:yes gene_type:complete
MRQNLFKQLYLEKKKIKKNQTYFFLTTPKISLIVPKFKDKFLVISQKRIPINTTIYEFPGGSVENNETPQMTAINELKEETGYISKKKPKKFLSIYPDPGRLNCSCECFFSYDIEKIGKPELGIKLHLLSKNEILKLIKLKKFSHSCHVSAFLYFINQKIYLSDK